ncbi:MAG: hypothetical protein ACLFMO_06085 [Eubacteriales bacterium]
MTDKFLYQKIFEGVDSLCKQKGFNNIKRIELVINKDSEINSKMLKRDLINHLPLYVTKKTKVIVKKDEIGGIKAIIKNVEGL